MASVPESDPAVPLERERRALRSLARSLLGAGGDADDLAQDACVAALSRQGSLPDRVGPWLTGVVRHLAGMWRRAEGRRRAREATVARSEADATGDPAAIAAQAEVVRAVAAAVHELEEPFRTVVVLRFWRGMLPEAIAQELGVPRNTVRSRLQRGLERLRARLDRQHGDRERWSAPLCGLVDWRPASPVAVGAAGLTVLGVIMQAKLWVVGAAVLLAAVAVPWAWGGEPAVAPELPAGAPAVVQGAAASGPLRPPDTRREDAAPRRQPR